MSFQPALPPWLTKAVDDAGEATVILKPGDRPFVIKSKAPYHLGTQPMTTMTMEGLAQQILSEDAQHALDKGENVEETLKGDQMSVTVTAVKMDHDIVIKLRNAEPKEPEVDEIAQQIEEETRIIKADVAAALRAAAQKAHAPASPTGTPATPAPAPEGPPTAARAQFRVETAGGETVADIQLPLEEVDTLIAKLSTAPAAQAASAPAEEPAPQAPARVSAFARLSRLFGSSAAASQRDEDARTGSSGFGFFDAVPKQEEVARSEQNNAAPDTTSDPITAIRKREESAHLAPEEDAAHHTDSDPITAIRNSEQTARYFQEDAARRAQEEAARREQEEAVRREQEETARRAEEEAARRAEQEEAVRQEQIAAVLRAQEEALRREHEEAARLEQEEAARRAHEEAARVAQEETARQEQEAASRREREEAERCAREDAARRELEERAQRAREEAESARRELEDKARRAQEEADAVRRELAEVTRREREELARREQEEAVRRELEEQTRRAQEETVRREQEELARRERETSERRAQEEAARRELEERAQRVREEAEAARREFEEKARHAQAEADAARRELAEVTRRAQEENVRREQEELARREREASERREQEEATRRDLEEKARIARAEADAARRELAEVTRRTLKDAARGRTIAAEVDADARTEPASARATVVDLSRRGPLSTTTELTDWILEAIDQGATALYLRAGKGPCARIDGQVEMLAAEPIPASLFERAGASMSAGEDGWQPAGEWAWTKHIPGTGSVHCQAFSDGQGGGFIVQLPVSVAALDEQVPRHIRNACDTGEGLVVISAPFAEEVAAMVGAVVAWNARRRAGHIISFGTSGSLERVAGNAFISDRPLPSGDHAMATALHGALRERPDMLVVLAGGPLPAADAVISASVGRLVIVGVVARTAPRALEVLMTGLGSSRQLLAANFKAACSWRGFRTASGRRLVVSDTLVASDRVSTLIDAGDIAALHLAQVNREDGMRAVDAALAAAVARRKITLREAAASAVDRKSLISIVRRQAGDRRAAERHDAGASQRAATVRR